MRVTQTCAQWIGALVLCPALAVAAPPARHPASPTAVQSVKDATHATNGIVRSVNATTLVIAKTATATKTQSFVLTPSTASKGDIKTGARVEVRYRTDGSKNIATAVTASPIK